MFNTPFTVKLARTLWLNAYRAQITDSLGEYCATLRLFPQIPLDRHDVPENAPEAKPYLVIPMLSDKNLIEFEHPVSVVVMEELSKLGLYADSCQFVYPNLVTELEQPVQQ